MTRVPTWRILTGVCSVVLGTAVLFAMPSAVVLAQGASAVPPAAPLAAPAASSAGSADSGGYNVRLKALERNVNELKEQVFRTKARLNLLKETVLGVHIGASRGIIRHKNEMSGTFKLIKAVYALDGVQIFSRADDSGHLADMGEFDIYNGAIQQGSHSLSVSLQYQGNGFGVFSYLKGYKFNVRASNTFVAAEGKATVVTVVGFEKGGITTNMEEKPDIQFRVNVMNPEGSGTAAKK